MSKANKYLFVRLLMRKIYRQLLKYQAIGTIINSPAV